MLRERHPELDFRDVRTIEDGWDSLVLEVDGYIFRSRLGTGVRSRLPG